VTIAPHDIWYEDAWLLVLNKRAGWYTGATPWDTQGNALAALTRFLTCRDGVVPTLHLAHQLDRGTSGLLLCSRHPTANAPLQAAFASGAVEKRYLCLCMGAPDGDTFELRTGHGRSRGGRWRLYGLEEVGQKLPGGSRIKLAHTSLTVRQRIGDAALLDALLHTGRTHQVRLHAASLGHPLIGDTRYGGGATFRGQPIDWPLLHAASLRLRHPLSGELLVLDAPLPAWASTDVAW
jgi:23S rRNA pseudouridine1911/1915/1917 synthase